MRTDRRELAEIERGARDRREFSSRNLVFVGERILVRSYLELLTVDIAGAVTSKIK